MYLLLKLGMMLKMKKNIIIFILMCILLISIFIFSFYQNKISDNKIALRITELKIESFTKEHIRGKNIFGYELPSDVFENMGKYKVIKIMYHIENNSDKIEMEDVRCCINFKDNLKVISYNSGTGIYYLNILPNESSGFIQYIIIEDEDRINQELYNKILNQQIRLTFYTKGLLGLFRKNTGYGHTGLGKYVYKFKINDVLEVK